MVPISVSPPAPGCAAVTAQSLRVQLSLPHWVQHPARAEQRSELPSHPSSADPGPGCRERLPSAFGLPGTGITDGRNQGKLDSFSPPTPLPLSPMFANRISSCCLQFQKRFPFSLGLTPATSAYCCNLILQDATSLSSF